MHSLLELQLLAQCSYIALVCIEMKACAIPLLAIFEAKAQLEVPLFQRQYVWEREEHWSPLWDDIHRKFVDYLEGREGAPVHFLGAMVLDQKQQPITHLQKRQVIDGQQRLTTFQIFLATYRDFARAHQCEEIAEECGTFTTNRGMMKDRNVDCFKVWPTQSDRAVFRDVMKAGSAVELNKRHPQTRRKYARKPNPRPKMVEAYLYFYEQLRHFFIGTQQEQPMKAMLPLEQRLDKCFQALRNALQVVEIDLEQGDDAQVIFETLNARGEPLLPGDLLRNYIFLRAARQGEASEKLYDEYWRPFDDAFWRAEVKQGRLKRPRSDLFLQHFLASRTANDIPIRHLFVEYKHWISSSPKIFSSIEEELKCIAKQGGEFRRILEPKKGDPIYSIVCFLDSFDIRTVYPLLLTLLEASFSDAEWRRISEVLESYLVRRAVCQLTTKNLNRVFLNLTRILRRDGISVDNLVAQMSSLSGSSVGWPDDSSFLTGWQRIEAGVKLANPKLDHILKRINRSMMTTMTEPLTIEGKLTIEHIMPKSWYEHWPLRDGSRGVPPEKLDTLDDSDRIAATLSRIKLVQTFGNLTILTQPLNSSVSNSAWSSKRVKLKEHSLLLINRRVCDHLTWDEDSIRARSASLGERALKIWRRG